MTDPVSFRPLARTDLHLDKVTRGEKSDVRAHAPVRPNPGPGRAASLPKLVKLAQELASQGPPIDHAHVAQVRQAIADRSYKIDPDRIASAMLAVGRTENT